MAPFGRDTLCVSVRSSIAASVAPLVLGSRFRRHDTLVRQCLVMEKKNVEGKRMQCAPI